MSNLKLEGFIEKIFDLETFPSGFQKRSLLLTTRDTYPKSVLFDFPKDKSDLIDPYKEGDDVIVHFNLESRAWESPKGETKYFTGASAWRIEKDNGDTHDAKPFNETPKSGSVVTGRTATPQQAFDTDEDSDSELPF